VTLEVGYEMVLFGTGDREHPNDKIVVNRLYAVKDKNLTDTPSGRAYIESDLYDATYKSVAGWHKRTENSSSQRLKCRQRVADSIIAVNVG